MPDTFDGLRKIRGKEAIRSSEPVSTEPQNEKFPDEMGEESIKPERRKPLPSFSRQERKMTKDASYPIRLWQGRLPLPVLFWGYFAVPALVLFIVSGNSFRYGGGLSLLAWVVLLMILPVWRASIYHPGRFFIRGITLLVAEMVIMHTASLDPGKLFAVFPASQFFFLALGLTALVLAPAILSRLRPNPASDVAPGYREDL